MKQTTRTRARSARMITLKASGFLCPITTEVIRNIVIAADGFAYERDYLTQYFAMLEQAQKDPRSPMTNSTITTRLLTPRLVSKLAAQIKPTESLNANDKLTLRLSRKDLLDPITGKPIVSPVLTSQGHVYDKANLEQWFFYLQQLQVNSNALIDPITRETIDAALLPCHVLKEICDSADYKSHLEKNDETLQPNNRQSLQELISSIDKNDITRFEAMLNNIDLTATDAALLLALLYHCPVSKDFLPIYFAKLKKQNITVQQPNKTFALLDQQADQKHLPLKIQKLKAFVQFGIITQKQFRSSVITAIEYASSNTKYLPQIPLLLNQLSQTASKNILPSTTRKALRAQCMEHINHLEKRISHIEQKLKLPFWQQVKAYSETTQQPPSDLPFSYLHYFLLGTVPFLASCKDIQLNTKSISPQKSQQLRLVLQSIFFLNTFLILGTVSVLWMQTKANRFNDNPLQFACNTNLYPSKPPTPGRIIRVNLGIFCGYATRCVYDLVRSSGLFARLLQSSGLSFYTYQLNLNATRQASELIKVSAYAACEQAYNAFLHPNFMILPALLVFTLALPLFYLTYKKLQQTFSPFIGSSPNAFFNTQRSELISNIRAYRATYLALAPTRKQRSKDFAM